MKHYEDDISALLDNELSGAEEQAALFSHISTCKECRAFFTDAILLKSKTTALFQTGVYVKELSHGTPVRHAVRKSEQTNVFRYLSAAAGLAVIFLLTYGWLKIIGLQEKLDTAEKNYTQLSSLISVPRKAAQSFSPNGVETKDSQTKLTINQTKTAVNKNIRKTSGKTIAPRLRKKQFTQETIAFTSVTISKEDFISPQRVGN